MNVSAAASRLTTVVEQHDLHVYHAFARTLHALWQKSGQQRRLGLAISGGVDSMALATLCREVTDPGSTVMAPLLRLPDYTSPTPSFTAFIVDHKMRQHSESEARKVSHELAELGIDSRVLELDWAAVGDPALLPNVETTARRLRYRTLGRACREHDIKTLLVAHHRDDQAETVLTRIVAGYGGAGLRGIKAEAAMPECHGLYGVDHSGDDMSEPQRHEAEGVRLRNRIQVEFGGVRIARPLLAFDKEQLVDICKQNKVKWFEDHTNTDPTLTVRNTVRMLLQKDDLPLALRSGGLIALASKRALAIEEEENAASAAYGRVSISLDLRSGRVTFAIPPDTQQPSVFSRTACAILLRKLIDLVTPLNTVSLTDLHRAVNLVFNFEGKRQDEIETEPVQVAGAHIERAPHPDNNRFSIHRSSPTRREKNELQVVLSLAQSKGWSDWQLWDGRFWIRVCPPRTKNVSDTEIVVRFLIKEDIAALRKALDGDELSRLQAYLDVANGNKRHTCPAIIAKWKSSGHEGEERIVALPSLGWSNEGWERDRGLPSRDRWQWDIRYKHVDLSNNGMHKIVS